MYPKHKKEVNWKCLVNFRLGPPFGCVLQELNPFRGDADKLFERFFGKDVFELDIPMLPAVESFIEDGKLCMRFDVPGVDPKDIDISIAGDTVTVRASRERRSNQGDGHFKRTEVSYGRFERSMPLPEGVKGEQLKATYHNGVLELNHQSPRNWPDARSRWKSAPNSPRSWKRRAVRKPAWR